MAFSNAAAVDRSKLRNLLSSMEMYRGSDTHPASSHYNLAPKAQSPKLSAYELEVNNAASQYHLSSVPATQNMSPYERAVAEAEAETEVQDSTGTHATRNVSSGLSPYEQALHDATQAPSASSSTLLSNLDIVRQGSSTSALPKESRPLVKPYEALQPFSTTGRIPGPPNGPRQTRPTQQRPVSVSDSSRPTHHPFPDVLPTEGPPSYETAMHPPATDASSSEAVTNPPTGKVPSPTSMEDDSEGRIAFLVKVAREVVDPCLRPEFRLRDLNSRWTNVSFSLASQIFVKVMTRLNDPDFWHHEAAMQHVYAEVGFRATVDTPPTSVEAKTLILTFGGQLEHLNKGLTEAIKPHVAPPKPPAATAAAAVPSLSIQERIRNVLLRGPNPPTQMTTGGDERGSGQATPQPISTSPPPPPPPTPPPAPPPLPPVPPPHLHPPPPIIPHPIIASSSLPHPPSAPPLPAGPHPSAPPPYKFPPPQVAHYQEMTMESAYNVPDPPPPQTPPPPPSLLPFRPPHSRSPLSTLANSTIVPSSQHHPASAPPPYAPPQPKSAAMGGGQRLPNSSKTVTFSNVQAGQSPGYPTNPPSTQGPQYSAQREYGEVPEKISDSWLQKIRNEKQILHFCKTHGLLGMGRAYQDPYTLACQFLNHQLSMKKRLAPELEDLVLPIKRHKLDPETVARPTLGAVVAEAQGELPGNTTPSPLLVICRMSDRSPLRAAGITEGDILVSWNGFQMCSASDLRNCLAVWRPHDSVDLKVLRGSQLIKKLIIPTLEALTVQAQG